jgi:uncharacterized protein (TIGR02266 family)
MRLRNSAVPGVDPVSAPESVPDADALARSIAQLNDDVHALSERAARLHQAGHPEAEWLLARFQTHRLASPDLSGPAARMLVQAGFAALDEHRAGLARDAAELARVEAAAAEQARAEEARRAEAARKEAEEARARREAQAAAQRRPATAPVLSPQGAPAPARAKSATQPLGKMCAPAAAGRGRTGARIPMQTQVDLSSDSNVFTGFSTNLSEGGVFVATINLLPVGTPVDLTFTLPGNTRLTVKGEVRWTREIDDRVPDVFPGVGVRFVELGMEAAQALHKFVAAREPLFYPD